MAAPLSLCVLAVDISDASEGYDALTASSLTQWAVGQTSAADGSIATDGRAAA